MTGVRSATPKGLFIRREIGKIWRFWTVGGGDSFASGLIYGFLAGKDPQWAVECGAAHGALAMTTPGDTTMTTLDEVLQVMKAVGARISR
jgi:2-dehydro-3-deoxygluconokinase